MSRAALACALAALLAGPAHAADGLGDPRAYEYADGMSFYRFDACGDGLPGRLYRRALAEKLAHCPFTPAARAQFSERARGQRRKSADAIEAMIADRGGLPRELDGMASTCHAQMADPDYQRVRALLLQYGQGTATAETVLPAACDAENQLP